MKKVFFDTEFTRIGQNTTLISIGFVSESEERLYLEFNDFARSQVTPWLEQYVMRVLERKYTVNTREARIIIEKWFQEIAPQGCIQLISAGKDIDMILLYNIWAETQPGSTLRTWRDRLPRCIDHKWHLDLDTVFTLHGIDPNQDRSSLIEIQWPDKVHHALYDACMIKACWEKLSTLRCASP